jgi:hypothetical protein
MLVTPTPGTDAGSGNHIREGRGFTSGVNALLESPSEFLWRIDKSLNNGAT